MQEYLNYIQARLEKTPDDDKLKDLIKEEQEKLISLLKPENEEEI